MSGIVGLVQFDGAPLAKDVLQKLTGSLSFRGPDAQRTWLKTNVGFGHTLFKTTHESEFDIQPLTLDGRSWIVADARIDAREDLLPALERAGEHVNPRRWTDAELILRAYRCWGADCVHRLLGDFAFGIWDDERQRLFCARDHMGVKPFFYARIGSLIIFSNTLDCIRLHPMVSNRLNELAIADFLIFEFNQDAATTCFADIERLPPAHSALFSRTRLQLNRYWSMPIDEPVFYKRATDYVDRFHALLQKCVTDRLRSKKVWIFLSGGLDSPTLAVFAREKLQKTHRAEADLSALTKTDEFVPEEARYAQSVATFLNIPIKFRKWFEEIGPGWEEIPFCTPEPFAHAWTIPAERRFWLERTDRGRVFFYGEGPDNALHCDWAPYIFGLVSRGSYRRLLHSVLVTLISERRLPFWGAISNTIRRLYTRECLGREYPKWLNRELETRLCLRERWVRYFSQPSFHRWRPRGYGSFQTALWQALFESLDAGATQSAYEIWYPFLDIRILRFFLSLPVLPWCRSKRLLRVAMRAKLPVEVLRRRKTTIDSNLVLKYLKPFCQQPMTPARELQSYVTLTHLEAAGSAGSTQAHLRVRSLNHWLKHSYAGPHNAVLGNSCGYATRE